MKLLLAGMDRWFMAAACTVAGIELGWFTPSWGLVVTYVALGVIIALINAVLDGS